MKHKLIFSIVGATLFLSLLSGISYMQNNDNKAFQAIVISSKNTYFLGEVVSLECLVKNTGIKNVKIAGELGLEDGTFSIWVSKDAKTFEKYNNTTWGKVDRHVNRIELKPDETVSNQATVLWNSKPKTSDPAFEKKITTDYAFPVAGDYYVKLRYVIYPETTPVWIESVPIKISITKPEGDELEVWNKIKDNGYFAYFIQEGDMLIPSYKSEERLKFQTEIEQILTDYPNSFYATSLSQSLNKFKASEAKRKEFIKKHKQPE
jgi:hypothetical protein